MRCDEGGEAPCFAHLLDESSGIPDAPLGDPVAAPDADTRLDDPPAPSDAIPDGPGRRRASATGRHHDPGASATATRNVAANGEPGGATA